MKNSSGRVRVAKKKVGSGRVAGTRQTLVLTWASNIYHKGPELLVTNKPKRGEFPSSIRYLPHLCNDLARGMVSLWSHSDSAKNQWAGLSAVLPLKSASHRGFPQALPAVGRKVCAQKDGLHWVQTWTPWNTNITRALKRLQKRHRPPLISEIIRSKFSAMTNILDIEYFPKQTGMANKWQNPNFSLRYKLLTLITLLS